MVNFFALDAVFPRARRVYPEADAIRSVCLLRLSFRRAAFVANRRLAQVYRFGRLPSFRWSPAGFTAECRPAEVYHFGRLLRFVRTE